MSNALQNAPQVSGPHCVGPQILPKSLSQHQLHYKILSRLCTTLQRSPNASRARISTPTALQNSFKVLPYFKEVPNAMKAFLSTATAPQNSFKVMHYITEVPKCFQSPFLNTNFTTKFYQGSALHYKGPQMPQKPFSQHQMH
jgi:hypothetical protein